MKDVNYETLMDELVALSAKVSVLEEKEYVAKGNEEPPTLECMDDISHSFDPPHDDPSTPPPKMFKKVVSKP